MFLINIAGCSILCSRLACLSAIQRYILFLFLLVFFHRLQKHVFSQITVAFTYFNFENLRCFSSGKLRFATSFAFFVFSKFLTVVGLSFGFVIFSLLLNKHKPNLSLSSLYYAEACNELTGPISVSLRPGYKLLLKKCCSGRKPLATCVRFDWPEI